MAAGALEQYITNVQTLSAQGSLAQLTELTRNTIATNILKAQQHTHLDNALQTLDLQQHSIGILAILHAKLFTVSSQNGLDIVVAQIREFAGGCNGEQIRQIPEIYCELFHCLTEWFLKKDQPGRGISLLIKAIERLQTCPTQLTSIHSDLCCLCLKAKIFNPALRFLDADITDIVKEFHSNPFFDSKYFLQYYYYGGMIYGALKQFERSLYFFEVALTTPAVAVSCIMIESYKKYVLISLLSHGKVMPLPAYKSPVINRFIKPNCQTYTELAKLVELLEYPSVLEEFLHKNRSTFLDDSNIGLVKQVIKSQLKRFIQRLTKTFLTLSLADVATQCRLGGPQDAEKHILSMIEDGEILATIDQQNGMVQFHDDPERFNTTETTLIIDQELNKCLDVQALVNKLDTDTLLNPQYVNKISKSGSALYGASSTLPAFHEDEGVSVGSAMMHPAPGAPRSMEEFLNIH